MMIALCLQVTAVFIITWNWLEDFLQETHETKIEISFGKVLNTSPAGTPFRKHDAIAF